MRRLVLLVLLVSPGLISCGGDLSSDGGGGSNTDTSLASLDCTGAVAFDPVVEGLVAPMITPATGVGKNTTIILMHGKTGRPGASFLASFQTDLAALGYKVVAPSMTWSTSTWYGELCEGLAYINELAEAEIDAGQAVVLAGHSMGAVYSLMYAFTQPASAIKAIVAMAPGHFMHQSNKLQTMTASDVARARDQEANSMGDVLDTYITLNGGVEQSITTTATRYLSYHDLKRVPGFSLFAPDISFPVLWISGSNDPLTINQNHAGLFALIDSAGSEYQGLTADHLGVVALTPDPINTWLEGL